MKNANPIPTDSIPFAHREKIEKLWLEVSKDLMRRIAGFCGSENDAEDVAQEVFLRLCRNPQILEEVKTPMAFLLVTARRIATDIFRKRIAEQKRSESQDAMEKLAPGGQAPVGDRELREAIVNAVKRLPAEQRRVFVAKVFQEKTLAQIAAENQLPLNTVASRLRYALDKIRAELRPWYEAMKTNSNISTNSTNEPIVKPLEPKRMPSVVPGFEGVAALAVDQDAIADPDYSADGVDSMDESLPMDTADELTGTGLVATAQTFSITHLAQVDFEVPVLGCKDFPIAVIDDSGEFGEDILPDQSGLPGKDEPADEITDGDELLKEGEITDEITEGEELLEEGVINDEITDGEELLEEEEITDEINDADELVEEEEITDEINDADELVEEGVITDEINDANELVEEGEITDEINDANELVEDDADGTTPNEEFVFQPSDGLENWFSIDRPADYLDRIFNVTYWKNLEQEAIAMPVEFTDIEDGGTPTDFLSDETGQGDFSSDLDADFAGSVLKEYQQYLEDNPDWLGENGADGIQLQVMTGSQHLDLDLPNPGEARAFDAWFEQTYLADWSAHEPESTAGTPPANILTTDAGGGGELVSNRGDMPFYRSGSETETATTGLGSPVSVSENNSVPATRASTSETGSNPAAQLATAVEADVETSNEFFSTQENLLPSTEYSFYVKEPSFTSEDVMSGPTPNQIEVSPESGFAGSENVEEGLSDTTNTIIPGLSSNPDFSSSTSSEILAGEIDQSLPEADSFLPEVILAGMEEGEASPAMLLIGEESMFSSEAATPDLADSADALDVRAVAPAAVILGAAGLVVDSKQGNKRPEVREP